MLSKIFGSCTQVRWNKECHTLTRKWIQSQALGSRGIGDCQICSRSSPHTLKTDHRECTSHRTLCTSQWVCNHRRWSRSSSSIAARIVYLLSSLRDWGRALSLRHSVQCSFDFKYHLAWFWLIAMQWMSWQPSRELISSGLAWPCSQLLSRILKQYQSSPFNHYLDWSTWLKWCQIGRSLRRSRRIWLPSPCLSNLEIVPNKSWAEWCTQSHCIFRMILQMLQWKWLAWRGHNPTSSKTSPKWLEMCLIRIYCWKSEFAFSLPLCID